MNRRAVSCFWLLPMAVTPLFANASWLSKITGVDIDLNRGTVSISRPDLNAIGPMLQNLPKDASQAILNPAGSALAEAIRWSRAQALNRNPRPVPPAIQQALSPYIPGGILAKARWTTAGGLSVDAALTNWFNQEGAITYDQVIVFADENLTNNVGLWAHELTHVLQYNQMGIDTFAFQYSFNWNALEGQARDNADRTVASINATQQGQQSNWSFTGASASSDQTLTWDAVNSAAKTFIPPRQCIWIDNSMNRTGNQCPVPIRVAAVVVRRYGDGVAVQMPCNEATCIFGPNQSGPLISPPWGMIVDVTAAWPM